MKLILKETKKSLIRLQHLFNKNIEKKIRKQNKLNKNKKLKLKEILKN